MVSFASTLPVPAGRWLSSGDGPSECVLIFIDCVSLDSWQTRIDFAQIVPVPLGRSRWKWRALGLMASVIQSF